MILARLVRHFFSGKLFILLLEFEHNIFKSQDRNDNISFETCFVSFGMLAFLNLDVIRNR